jgi:putative ABC transport system ATP-binding protein
MVVGITNDVGDPIFQVEHLSLVYPGCRGQSPVPILHDVSVDVDRGGALALVGPSGSGKSSLLRCLNRLEEPTSGVVRFAGRSILELDPRDLRRRAALVQQTPVLFEGTVRDNLLITAAGIAIDASDHRLRAMLGEVGLDTALLSRETATLSGGEKQRVTIARALLRDPQVLLLDEPTSALDPPNAAMVIDTVSRLRHARGLSIVAVTHSPELVHRLGGALLYLVKGRVEAHEHVNAGGNQVTDPRLRAFLAGDLRLTPSA